MTCQYRIRKDHLHFKNQGLTKAQRVTKVAIGGPPDKSDNDAWRLDFDRRLLLQFLGSVITPDVRLPAYHDLDDVLRLTEAAGSMPPTRVPARTVAIRLAGLPRQSVFGQLVSYEDGNDAERLCHVRQRAGWWTTERSPDPLSQPARWAALRRSDCIDLRTSPLLPICPASGSTFEREPDPGERYPRVGFIVITRARQAERVVTFAEIANPFSSIGRVAAARSTTTYGRPCDRPRPQGLHPCTAPSPPRSG